MIEQQEKIVENIVPEMTRQRVRITYEKGELIKFISHLDEFRMWERTVRRADLPLLYKQGFNPQPHMQFAAALGVGITGTHEILDITFDPPQELATLTEQLREKLPPGVQLHSLQEVPVKTAALQSLLIGADYTILLYAEPDEIPAALITQRIEEFLAQEEIWRERERKKRKYTYNLRPLVFELRYDGYDDTLEEHRIFLRVQLRPGASGRPDEVVAALDFDDFARTLRREHLYFSDVDTDNAVFDAYPVIEKSQVMQEEEQPRRSKRRWNKGKRVKEQVPEQGRSISERAGDEFG